ncbi:MAG: aminotransferase class IV [Anaerovoracaceae bacterium]|jgi:branched-chain amino acid aminotransferase
MDDNAGKYYIENGVMKEYSASGLAEALDPHGSIMIYEVIRIIDGIPLFFEDHYTRMCKSFQAIGNVCRIGAAELKAQIHKIVEANDNKNCNIKFIIFAVDQQQRVLGYISKSYYPTMEEIKKGVPVGLLPLERENPNIKFVDHDYKKTINKIKSEKGLYEVFLVDREGNVTEGGTSNIFFVKGNKIITAPEEKVLKGITRMHVIEVCKDMGYEVIETAIAASRLHEAEGVFLSGTSPKVLPVSSIDEMKYSSAQHPVISAIREAFDNRINEYLMKNR